MDAWRHVRAVLLLPVAATLAVPGALLHLSGLDPCALGRASPAARAGLALLGAALVALGLLLVVATVRLLATRGRGTLAPWDPTRRLVVEGPYRHVRNPMISGVVLVLLGEAALAASPALLGWALLFLAGNALYMPLVEEPGLARRFGEAYAEYRRHVPRWLPRRRPWRGEEER